MNRLLAAVVAACFLAASTPATAQELEVPLGFASASASCSSDSASASSEASGLNPAVSGLATAERASADYDDSRTGWGELGRGVSVSDPTAEESSASASASTASYEMTAWCEYRTSGSSSGPPFGIWLEPGDHETDGATAVSVGCAPGGAASISGVLAHDAFGADYVVGERDGAPFTHALGLLTADAASQTAFGLSLSSLPITVAFGEDTCSVVLG